MKIAIIGSGYFGSAIALILSKKHNVDLYEKEKDILNGASKLINFQANFEKNEKISLFANGLIKKINEST